MNKINKVVLVVFSVIILILGVFINLLALGWLELDTAFSLIERTLSNSRASNLILVITEFCMIFAIISIFVESSDEKQKRNGQDVLMANDNGKLMISIDTIENLVNSVVKSFANAKIANTRIQLDNENNVIVLVNLIVEKDVVIKELTLNIQQKIKETIKKTSDLEVKEVNVRIKNIANQEEKIKE